MASPVKPTPQPGPPPAGGPPQTFVPTGYWTKTPKIPPQNWRKPYRWIWRGSAGLIAIGFVANYMRAKTDAAHEEEVKGLPGYLHHRFRADGWTLSTENADFYQKLSRLSNDPLFFYKHRKPSVEPIDSDSSPLLFVGTYTQKEKHVNGRGQGIYAYRMDLRDGSLSIQNINTDVGVNPSFLLLHPNKKYLYAVNEVYTPGGGFLKSFLIDHKTGKLKQLSSIASAGVAPCHLSMDREGKYLFTSNWMSGTIASFLLKDNGLMQLKHSGPLPQRLPPGGPNGLREDPPSPHAHAFTLDPIKQEYGFAIDMGNDQVLQYKFNKETGQLIPNPSQPVLQFAKGAGPRHIDFHPSGQYAYVMNELDNTVVALTFDQKTGTLTPIQKPVSTLPKPFLDSGATSYGADIHVDPRGNRVYLSNRGHDTIASFLIQENGGLRNEYYETIPFVPRFLFNALPSWCQSWFSFTRTVPDLTFVPTEGSFPRQFTVDPSGQFLLVANQNSDSIVTMKIDPEKGVVLSTGAVTRVPSPVALCFVPQTATPSASTD